MSETEQKLPTMSDSERLAKLEQAQALIREVEFSYPVGNETRRRIYRDITHTFGPFGFLGDIVMKLKKSVRGY